MVCWRPPPPRELAPPPTGIPESAPAFKVIGSLAFGCFIQTAILMWSTGKILYENPRDMSFKWLLLEKSVWDVGSLITGELLHNGLGWPTTSPAS